MSTTIIIVCVVIVLFLFMLLFLYNQRIMAINVVKNDIVPVANSLWPWEMTTYTYWSHWFPWLGVNSVNNIDNNSGGIRSHNTPSPHVKNNHPINRSWGGSDRVANSYQSHNGHSNSGHNQGGHSQGGHSQSHRK